MSNDLIFEKQTTAPVKRAGALSPLARKVARTGVYRPPPMAHSSAL